MDDHSDKQANAVAISVHPSLLRFSLSNLLILVTLLSVACIALKYANPIWWSILSSISLLLFMAAVVTAFVGQQEQRAFAIGFSACTVIYALLLLITGPTEVLTPNPYQSWLPTVTVLLPLHRALDNGKYVDGATGKEVPNYTPPTSGGGFGGGFSGGGFGGGSSVYYRGSPPFDQFMRNGHLLFLNLLGIVGGCFACFVHRRNKRNKDEYAEPALR